MLNPIVALRWTMNYIIKDGIVAKEDENNNILIVNILVDDEDVYKITKIGVFIFKMIQEGKSVEEISKSIISEYEVTKETVDKDIDRLIDDLLEKGIIEKSG